MDDSAQVAQVATKKGLKILTIHSEGLQGLAIITVIDELCSRISQNQCKKSQVPGELFDIICGTGIGTFIAALLGRYQLDIPRCKQAYMDLSQHIKECNASRRSTSKEIRQEDVQDFLQALTHEEGWSNSMNFSTNDIPAGRRHFVLACKHKSYGQSSIEVSHGANISAETLRKTARSKDAEVVIRTGHAVAHPVSASHLDINHGKTSIEKAGQDLHQIVVIAMRYTRTFCSPYEVTFVAKSGPSTAINPAVTPVAKFPSSPGKWMMQVAAPVTLPIRSAVMRPIKATMNTFSVYEHAHKGQQSAIARRSKSMSTMQWPFQGLEFDFDHVRSPITEAELEAEAPAQLSDPKRMFELEDRVYNFNTAIQGSTRNDSDMVDLTETRLDIRRMIEFTDISGLLAEAVSQYQSG